MVYSAVRINAAPGPLPIYFYRRVSPRPATRPREIITKPFIFCRTVTVLISWSVRKKAGIHSEEKTPITTVNILGALRNEQMYPFCRTKVTRMYFFILHLSIADILTAFFTLLPEMIWDVCCDHSLDFMPPLSEELLVEKVAFSWVIHWMFHQQIESRSAAI